MKATIERAFGLARGGQCRTLEDVKRILKTEHYESIESHLAGRSVRKQLTALMICR